MAFGDTKREQKYIGVAAGEDEDDVWRAAILFESRHGGSAVGRCLLVATVLGGGGANTKKVRRPKVGRPKQQQLGHTWVGRR